MAGRRPKPTALKKAQGNPGKRKLNLLEPQPEPVAPAMPDFLSKNAKKWWAYLAPMLLRLKVLTEAEQIALAHLCDQTAQLEEASRIIQKGGLLVKKQLYDRAGKKMGTIPVINPAYKAQSDLLKHVRALMNEFGLTPASRTKVSKAVQPEQLKRDPLGELRARAKRSR